MTARPEPSRHDCRCCGGTGHVESIEGETRPCSRCDSKGFDRWAEKRRPATSPFYLFPDHFKPRDMA